MNFMISGLKRMNLLLRLIIGLILGIFIGFISANVLHNEIPIRILATFNEVFGSFLQFCIPLIIIGFIIPGISDLGKGAGKALAVVTAIAYFSTFISGLLAFFVNNALFKTFFKPDNLSLTDENSNYDLLVGYVDFDFTPLMSVTTALILAFVIGIGISSLDDSRNSLKNGFKDFQEIISKLIKHVIVPLLPIHVMGIFSNMTYIGTALVILSIFIKVFIIIILLHIFVLYIQYTIAGLCSGKSAISLLKNMIPAYFTALGTQSSAATIPISLQQTKKNGVSNEIADFSIPLCATIHMSGSAITLTGCSMAILMLNGHDAPFSVMLPFIIMLGITIVAAPGAPGGAVIACLGVLQSILGFNEEMCSLIIALYVAQDSFGTACNVTGDGAIAIIMDRFFGKKDNERI